MGPTLDSGSPEIVGQALRERIGGGGAGKEYVAKDSAGFTYGVHNRLTEASLSGVPQVRYTYNGGGERVKKEASGITYYHYDPSGQLLAETDLQGQTLKEYLYLEGIPLAVAAAKATPSGVYALQGQDRSGQTFRLTLEPQTHTLSLEPPTLGPPAPSRSLTPRARRVTR